MARPASLEVAGYFQTPITVLPRIASVLTRPQGSAHGVLLEPLRRRRRGDLRPSESLVGERPLPTTLPAQRSCRRAPVSCSLASVDPVLGRGWVE